MADVGLGRTRVVLAPEEDFFVKARRAVSSGLRSRSSGGL
jgi:hypothetical protein